MGRARAYTASFVVLLLCVRMAAAQSGSLMAGEDFAFWLRYSGVLAIGWSVGVASWLVTGHQSVSCFFSDVPRAWRLWRKGVLTSILPVLKYVVGGALLLGLGVVLVMNLWGLWVQAFSVGLSAGLGGGAAHSLVSVRELRTQMDFLEANQRYLNERRVSVFTEYQKP